MLVLLTKYSLLTPFVYLCKNDKIYFISLNLQNRNRGNKTR